MKIGILTQPLHSNYGGILQNYALQKVLVKLGHTPVTIDLTKNVSKIQYLLSVSKTIVFKIFGKKRPFIKYKSLYKRNDSFDSFVNKNINLTAPVSKLLNSVIIQNKLDGIVVGSDQVWRPMYNVGRLNAMYLDFAEAIDIKRVAYAASFGVDYWEYDEKQTEVCRGLARRFNKISVREQSAVQLCNDFLGVHATQVLDPTLLLDCSDYEKLCADVPKCHNNFIFAYILDLNEEKRNLIASFEKFLGMPARIYSADTNASLTPEEWISMFRDASFVITDSFHGTCFSIIFERNFFSIGNKHRGATRFMSLLKTFNLNERLIDVTEDNSYLNNLPIDWETVTDIRTKKAIDSMTFLNDSLK